MKKTLALLALLIITGCSRVSGKALTFNENIAPTNKTYYIEAIGKQARSLEFNMYADMVENTLKKYKYNRVTSKSLANYILTFDYGIDGSVTRTTIQEDEDGSTSSSSSTYYKLYFDVSFVDNKTKKPIYNTNSSIHGGKDSFLRYSRCLIDFTFAEFPSKNKSIRDENIKTSECLIEEEKEDKENYFIFF